MRPKLTAFIFSSPYLLINNNKTMKYIKKFDRHADYEAYINGGGAVLPNVSYCVDLNEVHFNKYTPQPETRIVATFNVTDTTNPTDIVGFYEDKTGNIYFTSLFESIEIDGILQNSVVGYYQFDTIGEHTIKYTLTDPTSIGLSAFQGCTGLTSVTIPSGVTSIGLSAFQGCTGLTSVTIPSSVTSIEKDVFGDCTGLTSVELSNNLTSINEYAFNGCRSLTLIEIPSGVTSIGLSAFNSCTGLTSVTIPSGVTSIGQFAFYGCTGLTAFTTYATTPPTLSGGSVLTNTNDCPIYVPSTSVSAYQSASGWNTYASRIQAIPTA